MVGIRICKPVKVLRTWKLANSFQKLEGNVCVVCFFLKYRSVGIIFLDTLASMDFVCGCCMCDWQISEALKGTEKF